MDSVQLMEELARVRARQEEVLKNFEVLGKGIKIPKGAFAGGQVRPALLEWEEIGKEIERLLRELRESCPEAHEEFQGILDDVNKGIRVFCRSCLKVSWRCSTCPHCGSDTGIAGEGGKG